jgi:hypothetical protein
MLVDVRARVVVFVVVVVDDDVVVVDGKIVGFFTVHFFSEFLIISILVDVLVHNVNISVIDCLVGKAALSSVTCCISAITAVFPILMRVIVIAPSLHH